MRCAMRAAWIAAALWAAWPALAQQRMVPYGLLDMTVGRFQAAGADKVWRADSGGMTTSFLGIRGTDDLGGGLSAVYRIEHFLRADSGQAGRHDADAFWARDAYVGLSGAFGTTVLGRNTTPLFVSTLRFNAFGDSFAFSPSIRHMFTPALMPFYGDSGWSNSIAYNSTDHDGWDWRLVANLGEASPAARGKNTGASLYYTRGPLSGSLAWQTVRNGDGITPALVAAGFARQVTWQVGASYELPAAKLFGQFAHVDTHEATDSSTAMWSIGAAVPMGPGKWLAQFGDAHVRSDGAKPKHRTLSVGYDLPLSRSTDVYAVFVNDRITGRPTGNTLAAGARLRF